MINCVCISQRLVVNVFLNPSPPRVVLFFGFFVWFCFVLFEMGLSHWAWSSLICLDRQTNELHGSPSFCSPPLQVLCWQTYAEMPGIYMSLGGVSSGALPAQVLYQWSHLYRPNIFHNPNAGEGLEGDDSMVKNTCCFCRGPEYLSQHSSRAVHSCL